MSVKIVTTNNSWSLRTEMRYIFRHPDALEKILEPDGLLVMNVPHLRDLKVPRSPSCQDTKALGSSSSLVFRG